MPKVVPSQIVEFIDARFPVQAQIIREQNTFEIGISHLGSVNTVLHLIDQLPENLITLTGGDFIYFIEATNEIRGTVELWSGGQHKMTIHKMKDGQRLIPMTVVRMALDECPDQGIDETITDLDFIADTDFRDTLRQDISFVNQALLNAEWKATTVLAGSVIEALLLVAITRLKGDDPEKFERARDEVIVDERLGNPISKKLKPNPPNWLFFQLIYFALTAEIISETTATVCLLAKDFRNLIHPGASIRKKQKCDRDTALQAVGGMEHVISELSET